MAKITCGNCHQQHETVDDVKRCYDSARAETNHIPPTEKQVEFIKKILTEREVPQRMLDVKVENLDRKAASRYIDDLLGLPKKPVAQERRGFKDSGESGVTEGMYLVDGIVYKVQIAVHGSGRLYAKVLRGNSFHYAPGMVYRLKPEQKMTLAQAKEFGSLYGTCCVCGRTLTDEVSIANGIGPICGNRTDGWWAEA